MNSNGLLFGGYLEIPICLAGMFVCFLAVFRTKAIMNFNSNLFRKIYFLDGSHNSDKTMAEKKWRYYAVKICGAIGMSIVLTILFATVQAMMNSK